MLELTSLLKQIGEASVSSIWFPLLLWTAAALLARAVLKLVDKTDVLYQYHIRVALIAGLPVSMLLSRIVRYMPDLFSSSSSAQLSFFVVQNPIAVTAAAGDTAAETAWSHPNVLLGVLTVSAVIISLLKIAQLLWNYRRLFFFRRNSVSSSLKDHGIAGNENPYTGGKILESCRLTFSDQTEIPFTFGWKNPLIVVPSFLKSKPSKLNMAIRHELMHIKRADYSINACILFIKSIFWFHPLLHLFHRDIKEYREISCDKEVLSDKRISRKQYARLLFELAPKKEAYHKPVVSMSIDKSTLKRRIRTMTKQTTHTRSLRRSILYSLAVLIGISGFIACSELQSTGFTNEDLAETQQQIEHRAPEEQPLYVINGEIPDQDNTREILARLKPKYIKEIKVLKGRKATDKYGSRGVNGVIELELLNKEKAMSDLLETPPAPKNVSPPTAPDAVSSPAPDISSPPEPTQDSPPKPFYVVAENMPKLVGGLKGLQDKIQYPEEARKQGIQGRVLVKFIVDEQGQVETPQIIKGIGGGCDKEALRVVKQAEFEPGTQNGKKVRVQYSLPIVYRL